MISSSIDHKLQIKLLVEKKKERKKKALFAGLCECILHMCVICVYVAYCSSLDFWKD